ncbi:hypothetical protein [Streptomyces albipurpureus]|uniref:Uncharacterized protein n=1 Tax=Streptomyces albipurpureus TaxID=2897419 RepID=A0ABT0UIF8_9ACTN|nr:hypothetical protein [Streptomyces sp. CWNU-1]MCM2387400.1 hypothetical protein [Streptomyces sp. CWNU-1]
MSEPAEICSVCKGWEWSGQQPNYDHIHPVRDLPEEQDFGARLVMRGFAAGFAGLEGEGVSQTWVFFEDLEPALTFGRVGQMSGYDISGYGVYAAARDICFESESGQRVTTLHVSIPALNDEAAMQDAFTQQA